MPVSSLIMANAVRALSMDAEQHARSGRDGLTLRMADVATVLWSKFLKYDAGAPYWPDRDRFVVSGGDGAMLAYALLHLAGFKALAIREIENFRQWGSLTPAHPEYGHTPGVETTTGPPGQGLAAAVGMAMAERALAARYGPELVDHRTWVVAGEACLTEGVSHEAISLAGRLKLDRMTVLFDDEDGSLDDGARLTRRGDLLARFKAAGWAVRAIDGHDVGRIDKALRWACKQARPTMIACRTESGHGAVGDDEAGHRDCPTDEEIARARAAMNWTSPPFVIPDDVSDAWKRAGRRGRRRQRAWDTCLAASRGAHDFSRTIKGELPVGAFEALDDHIDRMVEQRPRAATRVHSDAALAVLFSAIPELIGGSANARRWAHGAIDGLPTFEAPDYAGRLVDYGARQFAMASAMNGMAAHGGMIPTAWTSLVFSDYGRPAIRLGAMMGVRAIHVMTDDSIGVGEEGPTHHPVEHLSSLRAIPRLLVFRPADAVETAECWKLALAEANATSVITLSHQETAPVRDRGGDLSARGAYELRPSNGPAQVTIFASGAEVAVAVAAWERLMAGGIDARVVSTPCWELFDRQSGAYRAAIIGSSPVRIAVEAGVRQGWDRFIGEHGLFVGMSSFGASAPAERLFEAFGITADAVVTAAMAALNRP
jgi:transketolase